MSDQSVRRILRERADRLIHEHPYRSARSFAKDLIDDIVEAGVRAPARVIETSAVGDIEAVAVAWLNHIGLTEDRIRAAITGRCIDTCEFDTNHQTYDCTDENGDSLHPDRDAVDEATAMAEVAVEALEEQRRREGWDREEQPDIEKAALRARVAELEAQRAAALAELVDQVGWFEFIHPTKATTHIAGVYESGRVYLPEAPDVTAEDFTFAAAGGKAYRLVRAEDIRKALGGQADA